MKTLVDRNYLIVSIGIIFFHLIHSLVIRRENKQPTLSPLGTIKNLLCLSNVTAVGIFAATLYMYLKGSFSYAWFENGDPWRYAAAIKYIAVEKTYNAPFRFIEIGQPYPQAYQIIMAILSQINQSLNWTVKFFNSLIISLSLLYFYCLVRKITHNQRAALLATTGLASMPAWLSHFIFAINLSCSILPVFMYTLIKSDEHKRWALLGSAAFASIWLSHFSSAVTITLLFISYWLTKVLCENNLNRRLITIGIFGFVLSFLFWVPSLTRFSEKAPGGMYIIMPYIKNILSEKIWLLSAITVTAIVIIIFVTEQQWLAALRRLAIKTKIKNLKPKTFLLAIIALLVFLMYPHKFMSLRGSGSMTYNTNHFFLYARKANLIQNPFGIGPVAMIASICSLTYCFFHIKTLFTPINKYRAIIVALWLVCFLGVNGAHFSVNLMPFRMWAYFAFVIGLTIGLFYSDFIDKKFSSQILRLPITLVLMMCFIPTWHAFKFSLNSVIWRESYIGVLQGQGFLAWIKDNIPKNSKVYGYNVSQAIPIVYDMISYIWDKDIEGYQFNDTQRSIEHNYQLLKSKGYEYVFIDESLVFSHKFSRTYGTVPKEEVLKNLMLARIRKTQLLHAPDKFELIKKFEETGYLFRIL